MLGRTDEEQLAFASSLGRILYTANRSDFARLHAERMRAGATHAGIIIRVRQRMPVGAQIRALVAVNTLFGPGEMRSRLVYLDEYVE
jgi:hypothetical protein